MKMLIEQYNDRYINTKKSNKIMRSKNDNINRKYDLNKTINITKLHKQNNAKNKQVSIILNFNK